MQFSERKSVNFIIESDFELSIANSNGWLIKYWTLFYKWLNDDNWPSVIVTADSGDN